MGGVTIACSDVRGGHVTATEAIYDVPPASDASDHDYDDCMLPRIGYGRM